MSDHDFSIAVDDTPRRIAGGRDAAAPEEVSKILEARVAGLPCLEDEDLGSRPEGHGLAVARDVGRALAVKPVPAHGLEKPHLVHPSGDDNRLGLEDVELACPHVDAGGPHDPSVLC